MKLVIRWLGFPILLLSFYGCAHAPVQTPAETAADLDALFRDACGPGSQTKGVKGSVMLKAKSKEGSGQFPAMVNVSGPEEMKLEVTNLIGGTEAVISIKGNHYSLTGPSKKIKPQDGFNAWYGIPLNWATDLFLGRIPCPSPSDRKDAQLSKNAQGSLVVETPATLEHGPEKFVYGFRTVQLKPWPESLHWERTGALSATVDFKFDDPDAEAHSPKKWEAKSDLGEVKVRWRDREAQN